MSLCNLAGDIESQTKTLPTSMGLTSHERLEKLFVRLLRDWGPAVRHGDLEFIPYDPTAKADGFIRRAIRERVAEQIGAICLRGGMSLRVRVRRNYFNAEGGTDDLRRTFES